MNYEDDEPSTFQTVFAWALIGMLCTMFVGLFLGMALQRFGGC